MRQIPGLHGDERPPDIGKDRLDNMWAILIHPAAAGGELRWTLVEGVLSQDETDDRYILSPAPPPPGLFEGTVSISDLTVEERALAHMALVSRQDVSSLDDLARTVYWEASVLSGREGVEDCQLFRELLAEWVWRIKRRGLHPRREMAKLLDVAERDGPIQHDPEPRGDRVAWARPPLDGRSFERVRQRITERYDPGRIEGWSDDTDNALFSSPLLENDQHFEDALEDMITARATARPSATASEVAEELERIWSHELSYGSSAIEEAHTIAVESDAVTLRWIVAAPKAWYLTGRIVVDLQPPR